MNDPSKEEMVQDADEGVDETARISTSDDIIQARKLAYSVAKDLGFPPREATLIAIAVSELSRNMIVHASGGEIQVGRATGPDRGVRIVATDSGPGIPDIRAARREGFTTGRGLGMGLSVVQKAMDRMDIESSVGQGTTVVAEKWLRDAYRQLSR